MLAKCKVFHWLMSMITHVASWHVEMIVLMFSKYNCVFLQLVNYVHA